MITVPATIMGVRLITLLVKFALTLFIARFLGLEALGWFGVVAAIGVATGAMTGLGVMQVINRRAVTSPPNDLTGPITAYLAYVLCLYVAVLVIALMIGSFDGLWIIVVGIILLSEHLGNDSYQLLINRGAALRANGLHFLRAGFWPLVFMAFAAIMPPVATLEGLLAFWCAGGLASLLGTAVYLRGWPWQRVSFNREWPVFCAVVAEGRPLYVSAASLTAARQADRFIITALLGPAATGVYLFFLQIGSALNNLHFAGIVQMAVPRFVKAASHNQQQLRVTFTRTATIAAGSTMLASLIAVLLIDPLLAYAARPQLTAAKPLIYFVLVFVNLAVFAELQNRALYAQHKDAAIMRINLLRLAVGLPLLGMLILLFGLYGAATALIAQLILVCALQMRAVRTVT